MSLTSAGMGISRCADTSYSIGGMGHSGSRSPGLTGLPVPGWSTAAGGFGISAMTLYQVFGISESLRRNFTLIAPSPLRLIRHWDVPSFSHIPADRVSRVFARGQGLPDQEEAGAGPVEPPDLLRRRDAAFHNRVYPV